MRRGWLLTALPLFACTPPAALPGDVLRADSTPAYPVTWDGRRTDAAELARRRAAATPASGHRRAAAPEETAQAPAPGPASRLPVMSSGKLAVLDFRSSTRDLQADAIRYFTDVVRGASLKAAPGIEVMTRENLVALLQANGKDLAQCEGQCEVDTGRLIGADAIVSGEVLKVGSRYHISLKLHETHDGRLLSTSVASGKTVDELEENLQSAAADLLAPQR